MNFSDARSAGAARPRIAGRRADRYVRSLNPIAVIDAMRDRDW
jgi:hypothetical protein